MTARATGMTVAMTGCQGHRDGGREAMASGIAAAMTGRHGHGDGGLTPWHGRKVWPPWTQGWRPRRLAAIATVIADQIIIRKNGGCHDHRDGAKIGHVDSGLAPMVTGMSA